LKITINILRTSDDDVEITLVLPSVGGVGEGKRSAKECALYTSDRGWVYAARIICIYRWVTLEVCLFSDLSSAVELTKLTDVERVAATHSGT
jgi:hypothetical protein